MPGTATVEMARRTVTLKQETNYPWDGAVKLTVNPAEPAEFTIRVRVPGWAKGATVSVNKAALRPMEAGGFHRLEAEWTGEVGQHHRRGGVRGLPHE